MVTPQGNEGLTVAMIDVEDSFFTFKMYTRGGGVATSAFNYQCVGEN